MGGWIISSILIHPTIFDYLNTHLAYRGPHELTSTKHRGVQFVHNALYTSGGRVPQPLISEDKSVYAMVDGSIYNCDDFGPSYETSELCVLDAYKKYGVDFAAHLDGDFSAVIIDFTGNVLLAATDVFGTKPLFWALDDEEYGFSSHDTALGRVGLRDRKRVPPNTVLRFKLHERQLADKIKYHKFDLSSKNAKASYDDYNAALVRAVEKRALGTTADHKGPWHILGAGHADGVLASVLSTIDASKSFNGFALMGESFTKRAEEQRRAHSHPSGTAAEEEERWKGLLMTRAGYDSANEKYRAVKAPTRQTGEYQHTQAELFKRAEENLVSVGAGVAGAPAGLSDYRMLPQAVELGYLSKRAAEGEHALVFLSTIGDWLAAASQPPSKVAQPSSTTKAVFPWKHVSPPTCALREELLLGEFAVGAMGVETRYPFLDKQLIQEYHWLSPELKGEVEGRFEYMAPLRAFLAGRLYPTDLGGAGSGTSEGKEEL
jgi:hypothetical protein